MSNEEKVRGLVEWARLTDEEIQAIILNHKRYPQSNYASGRNELANSIAKAQRDKILSHPDLLTSGCILCPKCGKMIPEEEVKCQLKDKSQKEGT